MANILESMDICQEKVMNKENSIKNEWDRLKKEHPAIVSDDEMQEAHDCIEQQAHDCIEQQVIDYCNQTNVSDGSTASYYE